MTVTKFALKASLLALAVSTPLQAVGVAPAVPSIQDLAAFPAMSNVSLSPDGKHLVALQGKGEDRVILVWKTDALDQKPNVLAASQMKIRGVQFIKNDLLAVSLWQPFDFRFGGVTKDFLSKLYITDLEGKNWREPLPLPNAKSEMEQRLQSITTPTVMDILPDDPDHILVVNNVGQNAGDVFKVNVRKQRAERIQRSDENTAGYQADSTGTLRARIKSDVDDEGAFISTQFRDPNSGGWSEHFRSYVKNRDQQQVVGFARDPNIAYILSNVGEDKAYIYEYDIANKQKKELLFKHKFFDATGVVTFNKGGSELIGKGELIGITYAGPRGDDIFWTNPLMEDAYNQLRSAMGVKSSKVRFVDPATGDSAEVDYDADKYVSISSISNDLKTIVFSVSSANSPPIYYMVRDGKVTTLAKTYPNIDPAALGKTELVYYTARDGLPIPAFLTKPNEALCGAGPWKTVIHPHGGPWARDTMHFDGSMWVPLMASRCMAVLQPQYRGSDGWGRKLWMAGDREWGGKMQDDKDDGAQWLIDQGIARKDEIAMFGFSYGGYASMAAAVRPNGYYKCAISGAGVSDIRRIWSRYYNNPFFRDAQMKTVAGLSPLDKAAEIKIPIMVYHGERDQIVPIEQSDWYVEAAKKSGQPVEYHKLADYAHGPAWTREIMANQLGLIDTYFKTGCGGQGL